MRFMVSLSEAASLMGKKGGAAKTKRKIRAAIQNGKKGGRPRKQAPSLSSEQITK